MILTVTCNPAIDVTCTVDSLDPGQVHRVSSVVERPGGEGVNASRVLRQLGEATTATGFGEQTFGAVVQASGVGRRAIARGLTRGDTWPDIVADAGALSAAAVLAPVAGEVVLEAYGRWRPQVRLQSVESLPIER